MSWLQEAAMALGVKGKGQRENLSGEEGSPKGVLSSSGPWSRFRPPRFQGKGRKLTESFTNDSRRLGPCTSTLGCTNNV